MQDYLRAVIEPLLLEPQLLKVTETHDDMGILFSLDVGRNDMGPLIGKSGETIKAIRLIMRVYGSKNQARVSIKINEPEGSAFKPRNTKDLEEVLAGIK